MWFSAAAAAAAKSLHSCPTLCDPIDGSPPGFPVPECAFLRNSPWGKMCTLGTAFLHYLRLFSKLLRGSKEKKKIKGLTKLQKS